MYIDHISFFFPLLAIFVSSADMSLFFFSALLFFFDKVYAFHLGASDSEAASFSPRFALHGEMRRGQPSPWGTGCTTVYEVFDQRPFPSSSWSSTPFQREFCSNREHGDTILSAWRGSPTNSIPTTSPTDSIVAWKKYVPTFMTALGTA